MNLVVGFCSYIGIEEFVLWDFIVCVEVFDLCIGVGISDGIGLGKNVWVVFVFGDFFDVVKVKCFN